MPAKLPFPDEKVTWRIAADDMELLRAVHPNVNDAVRVLVTRYCDRLRQQLAGQAAVSAHTSD